jgi:hypothetical protein
LQKSLEIDGLTKLEYPTLKVYIKQNPPKVVIDNPEELTDDLIVTKVVETKTPDKAKIKELLKVGEVKGCHLEQGTRLEIK